MIGSVTADGIYDGEPTYAAAAARQRHLPPDVVVPPRTSAVPSSSEDDDGVQSQRDRHIRLMAERSRMSVAARGSARVSAWNGSGGWQKATGYGRRNQAETAMARYKHLISPKLRPEPACAKGRGRHRHSGAEQDDPNGKARLHPGRLDGTRRGPAQPSAGPCNKATAPMCLNVRPARPRRPSSHRGLQETAPVRSWCPARSGAPSRRSAHRPRVRSSRTAKSRSGSR